MKYYFVRESDIMSGTIDLETELIMCGERDFRTGIKSIARRILFLFVMASFLAACGGKEVKPLSPEAKMVEEAFTVSDALKNAYVKKDLATFERNSTRDEYRDLKTVMKDFQSAELTFTPTWVEITDSTVHLTISWKGTWIVRGKTSEERGVAIFVLEGRPLKVSRIERSNPFAQPE